MTGKLESCVLLSLFLIAGVIIAGCTGDSGKNSSVTTSPPSPAGAKYSAGDIIAKTDYGGNPLYVITNYNSETDKYTRSWIYQNDDGSWGHFIASKTEDSPRTLVEKVYPVTIAHVDVLSIPVVTPTVPVVTTISLAGPEPEISAISPTSGAKDGSVTMTITGKNFQTGAAAKLTQPGSGFATGSSTSVSATSITTTFNLNGKESGKYSVMVVNPDGKSAILQSGFTIGEVGPEVSSISPASAAMNDTVSSLTISGQNFKTSGVKVSFVQGSKEIVCEGANPSGTTTIRCGPVSFTLSNGWKVGAWDVRVVNIEGQQSATASQKFTLNNSTPSA
jgi:hypothetical protein